MKTAAPAAGETFTNLQRKRLENSAAGQNFTICIVKWLSRLNFADIGGSPPLPNNPPPLYENYDF